MITAAQVAKKAQQLGKQLQAVIEVGEFLEKLGDLDQAISEAQQTNIAASERHVGMQKNLVLTQEELDVARSSLGTMKEKIRQALDETNVRSAGIIANARKTAQKTLDTATAKGNEQINKATVSVQALEKKRANLFSEIAQLNADKMTLKKGLAALRERTRVED